MEERDIAGVVADEDDEEEELMLLDRFDQVVGLGQLKGLHHHHQRHDEKDEGEEVRKVVNPFKMKGSNVENFPPWEEAFRVVEEYVDSYSDEDSLLEEIQSLNSSHEILNGLLSMHEEDEEHEGDYHEGITNLLNITPTESLCDQDYECDAELLEEDKFVGGDVDEYEDDEESVNVLDSEEPIEHLSTPVLQVLEHRKCFGKVRLSIGSEDSCSMADLFRFASTGSMSACSSPARTSLDRRCSSATNLNGLVNVNGGDVAQHLPRRRGRSLLENHQEQPELLPMPPPVVLPSQQTQTRTQTELGMLSPIVSKRRLSVHSAPSSSEFAGISPIPPSKPRPRASSATPTKYFSPIPPPSPPPSSHGIRFESKRPNICRVLYKDNDESFQTMNDDSTMSHSSGSATFVDENNMNARNVVEPGKGTVWKSLQNRTPTTPPIYPRRKLLQKE